MRLLYFVNHYPVPNQPFYEDEAVALLRMGHDVWLLPVWGPSTDITKVSSDLRDRLIEMPDPFAMASLLAGLIWMVKKPVRYIQFVRQAATLVGISQTLRVFALARQIKKLRIDRIHAHFASNAALQALLCAEWLGVPYSCTGHGTEILIKREPYLPLLIQRARPFITVSEYNRQRLEAEVEAAKEVDIKVIRCGIDLTYFEDIPDRHHMAETPVILSVTWLRKVKGVPYLIDACAALRDRGYSFTCVIIGGGDLKLETEQQISELELGGHILLTGPLKRSDVLAWYRKADVFVLPSLSEGIPVVLMEAMAMKLPVVATRITGIPELVTAGEDGLLVEPGDGAALAEALETILRDPERRRRLGEHARIKIEQKFDLQISAGRLLDAFQETNDASL